MRLSLFLISCNFVIQLLFITDSDCSDKLFFDRYYVMKSVKRRASGTGKNDTTATTDILLNQLEMIASTSDNTTRAELNYEISNQDDVISSEFEAPEFACNRSHSQAAGIYCYGDILHVVMMLGVYNDSKIFVDKPLKKDPDEVIADFQKRFSRAITGQSYKEVVQFIEDNFGIEGEDLDE